MNRIEVKGELREQWCKCITDILKYYIRLCEKYHLRYFIAYGSAIGAARHHGIIPWDDDIDVVMPRPDFEKLLEICKHEDMGKYEIVSPFNTPNYYLPFYKMCNNETTLLENEDFKCVLGMYIDIFVYDGMVSDKSISDHLRHEYVKYWNRFTVASSYYSWERIKGKLKRGQIKDLVHYFLLSLNRDGYRKKFLRKLYDITHAYNYDDMELIVKYPPGYGASEVIPKEWIEESTLLPYEDLQVAIPKDYTRWLNNYFKDYTQLPPENERHPHHNIAYVNLKKRESLEEVLKKIKKRK